MAGLVLALASQLARVHSVQSDTMRVSACLKAAIPLFLVLLYMVFQLDWGVFAS
ncbi:MAG: hypothetical protein H7338_17760 [Candidatus Sericytochromatia bacterium]|nr:hypothetical protein [Candidatus Sericytochromatia bacterium]